LSGISKAVEKVGVSYVILSPMAIDEDADRGVRAVLEASQNNCSFEKFGGS
jgi:hypothetical protein